MVIMKYQGYVEKILFRNEDNGYTVLSLRGEKDDYTVVGVFGYISVGESIEIEAEETKHNIYGDQLKMISYKVKVSTDAESARKYLSSGAIKGIGPMLALRIVEKFEDDTFRIMEEEPERLAEVRGISLRKAREISEKMEEVRSIRDVMMFLGEYGISPSLATKIYDVYGEGVYDVVKSNPYRIVDDVSGVSFKTIDDIARKNGVEVNASIRIKSGMCYVLSKASLSGHTYLPKKHMVEATLNELGLKGEYQNPDGTYDMETLDKIYTELLLEKKLVSQKIDDEEAVFLNIFYNTEYTIARRLEDLNMVTEIDDYMTDIKIDTIENVTDIKLNSEQREAIKQTQSHGVSVLTGGPGTGKTTTINSIIRMFESNGLLVQLAAPTGRAAKRMSEATDRDAMTIHRLLEVVGEETETEYQSTFAHNENNPIDADVVILDEMSMVDTFLLCALLRALSIGTRLVLVGDPNQLASVGPGNVLKDIIASEKFSVIELTKVYRQEGKSGIVSNAHLINKGQHIPLDNKESDFLHISRNNTEAAKKATIGLVTDSLPKFVKTDVYNIQVLTPMKKGNMGSEVMNKELQKVINPKRAGKNEIELGNITFREGDKVMQVKNNYDQDWELRDDDGRVIEFGTGVFNGDIGVVQRVNPADTVMEVKFDDDRYVIYEEDDINELELAYAITIHKSQGSEYPAIVIPLVNSAPQLMTRNLLYTGITRAMKCVCLVGNENTVNKMIDNVDQRKRYSGLKWQLVENCPEGMDDRIN